MFRPFPFYSKASFLITPAEFREKNMSRPFPLYSKASFVIAFAEVRERNMSHPFLLYSKASFLISPAEYREKNRLPAVWNEKWSDFCIEKFIYLFQIWNYIQGGRRGNIIVHKYFCKERCANFTLFFLFELHALLCVTESHDKLRQNHPQQLHNTVPVGLLGWLDPFFVAVFIIINQSIWWQSKVSVLNYFYDLLQW